jgi:lipopolysaccharide/colanic/teichoic acid biosynthesis glycosyltransferase
MTELVTDHAARAALREVAPCPPYSRNQWRIKRALDVLLVSFLSVVLLLPMLVIALLIAIDSPGPVLFRQRRVGRDGQLFTMWKFRSMVRGAEGMADELIGASRDPQWLDLERDPRVTRMGHVLRRSSVDELPQLWNVLRGQMTLVGPRPLSVPDDLHVPAWAERRRHAVPGLTGEWQVSGRASLAFEDMLALDCDYARNWSWRRDISLLIRTVPAVLTGRGAN